MIDRAKSSRTSPSLTAAAHLSDRRSCWGRLVGLFEVQGDKRQLSRLTAGQLRPEFVRDRSMAVKKVGSVLPDRRLGAMALT
jgi:hypothetical protein